MGRKKISFLLRIRYRNKGNEYNFFYKVNRDMIKLHKGRITFQDNGVLFTDGVDNVDIFIYDNFYTELIEDLGVKYKVKLYANREAFVCFRDKTFIKEKGTNYNYYYRSKVKEG